MNNLHDYRKWTLGISVAIAAKLCHTTVRTFKRWEKKNSCPGYVKDVLDAHVGYVVHEGFEGWRFHNGMLWTPEGYSYSAGDIRAFYWKNMLLHDYTYSESLRRVSKPVRHDGERVSNVIPFPDLKSSFK